MQRTQRHKAQCRYKLRYYPIPTYRNTLIKGVVHCLLNFGLLGLLSLPNPPSFLVGEGLGVRAA
jgi:hypothetical protein